LVVHTSIFFLTSLLTVGCLCAMAIGQTIPSTQPSAAEAVATLRFEPNDAVQWKSMFPEDKEGFTLFYADEDGRTVFISSSEGSDSNDGFVLPIRTMQKAEKLLRNGYPDRLLFKRGDVFRKDNLNEPFEREGRSEAEPMVIGSYGDGKSPRPILCANLALGGRTHPSFLVVHGLDFYADLRDPDSPDFDLSRKDTHQGWGINMFNEGSYLWIEDCRFRFFTINVELQAGREPYHGLIFRRNVVADSFDPGGRSQGMYMYNIEHVLIEENLFDHNGWNDRVHNAGKTIFNHNMYLQHGQLGQVFNIIVRNNITARAASHGCQLRPGGIMENNLFLKNALAGFVSYAPSLVKNNVVLGGDSIGREPRGSGLEFLNCPLVLVEGNIVAHKRDRVNDQPALGYGPEIKGLPVLESRAEVRGNIVYDWTGLAFATHAPGTGLSVHDNIFQQGDQRIASLVEWPPGYDFENNRYQSTAAKPFKIGQTELNPEQWCAVTGDTWDNKTVQFADPSRDIVSYAKSIGLTDPTLEGFLAAAADQYRGHWDPRLTANAVNDYIRAGFTETPATMPATALSSN
jgi:hypothetical protein